MSLTWMMWQMYLWNEEDGAHDKDRDDEEEAEWDTKREIAR